MMSGQRTGLRVLGRRAPILAWSGHGSSSEALARRSGTEGERGETAAELLYCGRAGGRGTVRPGSRRRIGGQFRKGFPTLGPVGAGNRRKNGGLTEGGPFCTLGDDLA